MALNRGNSLPTAFDKFISNGVNTDKLDTALQYIDDIFILACVGKGASSHLGFDDLNPKKPIPAYIDCDHFVLKTTLSKKRGFYGNDIKYLDNAFNLKAMRSVHDFTDLLIYKFNHNKLDSKEKRQNALDKISFSDVRHKKGVEASLHAYHDMLENLPSDHPANKDKNLLLKVARQHDKGYTLACIEIELVREGRLHSFILFVTHKIATIGYLNAIRNMIQKQHATWEFYQANTDGDHYHKAMILANINKGGSRFFSRLKAGVCLLVFFVGMTIFFGGYISQTAPELISSNPEIMLYLSLVLVIGSLTAFALAGICCIHSILGKH